MHGRRAGDDRNNNHTAFDSRLRLVCCLYSTSVLVQNMMVLAGRQATTQSTIYWRLVAVSSLFNCNYREHSACLGQGVEQFASHTLVLPLLGAIAMVMRKQISSRCRRRGTSGTTAVRCSCYQHATAVHASMNDQIQGLSITSIGDKSRTAWLS